MKQNNLKCMLGIVAATVSMAASAYDFEAEGLYYNILTDSTAEVTAPDGNYTSSEVTIPTSASHDGKTYTVTAIGERAFMNCSTLSTVKMGATVTEIGSSAFEGCRRLSDIEFSDRLTAIKSYAFYNCGSLAAAIIPDGVTEIGRSAFYLCGNLSNLKLPASLTEIESFTFSSCNNLEIINIPDGVTSIGSYAFWSCGGLRNVNIPDGITSIMASAFENCYNLDSLTIGSGTTSIGDNAFAGCEAISLIECRSQTPPAASSSCFASSTYTNANLCVAEGCLEAYKTVEPWSLFTNIEESKATAINNIATDENGTPYIHVSGNSIKVNASGHEVIIYSADGKPVFSGTDGTVSGLPKGTYIVKAGNKTTKIIKR